MNRKLELIILTCLTLTSCKINKIQEVKAPASLQVVKKKPEKKRFYLIPKTITLDANYEKEIAKKKNSAKQKEIQKTNIKKKPQIKEEETIKNDENKPIEYDKIENVAQENYQIIETIQPTQEETEIIKENTILKEEMNGITNPNPSESEITSYWKNYQTIDTAQPTQEETEIIEENTIPKEEKDGITNPNPFESEITSYWKNYQTIDTAQPTQEETEIIEENTVSKEEKNGITNPSPSKSEIISYWKNYKTSSVNIQNFHGLQLTNQQDIFEITPNTDINNLNVGSLKQSVMNDALHLVNTIRFASGLNEVNIGKNQTAFAQYATMINKLNLSVSHYPTIPYGVDNDFYQEAYYGCENSNLASGLGILDSVLEYTQDDFGSDNQLKVGHRRWLLNPSLTQIGFGQTEEFNALFVNNNDYNGQNADKVTAYPSTVGIINFMTNEAPLNIQFGENFDISNAYVEVIDLNTGAIDNSLNIDNDFTGNGRSLIFGYNINFNENTKLKVKVSGVKKHNEDCPIEYQIEFINID